MDEIYQTHQMLIPEQLEFIKDKDTVPVRINVDKGRLAQVVTNFLNNASKFTASGYIKLGYRYLPGRYRLWHSSRRAEDDF